MAIQHKDCPRCGATVGNYIARCGCGFSFDNLDDTDPTQRLEAMAEEERLYEDYLAARAKQAIAEAADARSGALKDPDNYYWATRVEQAEAARDALMAELYQQKLRNSEMLTAIEEAKSYSKKKLHAVSPDSPPVNARPRAALPATSPVSEMKPAAATRINGTPAPAVVRNQTQRVEAEFSLEVTATRTVTDTGEASTYTAKLEEILLTTARTSSPPPSASTAAPTPGREALQTSQLAAAVKKAARLVVAIDAVPIAVDTASDTPPPALRPEDRLEHDSRAIRVRAVAMAERLFGTADSSIQAAQCPASMDQPQTPSATHTDSRTSAGVADQTHPADPSRTPSTPPSVERGMSDAAANSEARQLEEPAHAEPPRQTPAKRPPRNTHLQRTKPVKPLSADSVPAQPAPEPYIEDRPSAIFRALQAAKAEKIVQERRAEKQSEPKHCPFCSAMHVGQVERCGCGYTFEKPIELPVLVLSSKERTELLDDGIQIKRPKPPR